jgi:rhodanese-related sulfurtransferase
MKAISRDNLNTMIEQRKDFVLINVLAPEQFNRLHIPGSISIPVDSDDFVEQVDRIAGSRDREVVVYCASFICDASTQAAEKLDQAGFTKVADYEGGTRDWFEHQVVA